MDYVAIEKWS